MPQKMLAEIVGRVPWSWKGLVAAFAAWRSARNARRSERLLRKSREAHRLSRRWSDKASY